jgi:hypothetical protein
VDLSLLDLVEVPEAQREARLEREAVREAVGDERREALLDQLFGLELGRALLLVVALPVDGETEAADVVSGLAEGVEGRISAAADRARLGRRGRERQKGDGDDSSKIAHGPCPRQFRDACIGGTPSVDEKRSSDGAPEGQPEPVKVGG